MTKLRSTLAAKRDEQAARRSFRRNERALADLRPEVRAEVEVIALRRSAS